MKKLSLAAFGLAAVLLSIPAQAGVDEGKVVFETNCVVCHGASGKGDGPAGASLDPKPADFTTEAFWTTRTTEDLTRVVTGGGASVGKSPIMPAWGPVIGEGGVNDVVAYLEATFKPKAAAAE